MSRMEGAADLYQGHNEQAGSGFTAPQGSRTREEIETSEGGEPSEKKFRLDPCLDHHVTNLDTPGPFCSNHENLHAYQNNPPHDSRSVSGLLTSYHGVAFQVQWNMVVALDAKERWDESEKAKSAYTFRTKDFKTEDPDAGKFDDVVWRYEILGNGSASEDRFEYNFLQAKHKLKEDEKISLKDLVKTKQKKEPAKKDKSVDKRPFALEKYFISYKDIKRGEKYKDGHVGNLIIVTNIDLDEDLKNNLLSQVKDVPILDLIESVTYKEPDVWKLSDNLFSPKNDVPILDCTENKTSKALDEIFKQLQGTYDAVKLAKELVESVLNNKVISEKSYSSSYLTDLRQNEIISESGKLTQLLLDNSQQLSSEVKEFRRLLLKVGFQDKQPSSNNNYEITEQDEFANEIAFLISSSTGANRELKVDKRKPVFKSNISKLANYVLVEDDNKRVKFSSIFWEKDENELPGNLGKFREKLQRKLIHYSIVDQQDGPAVIAEKLQNYYFKITNFSTCVEYLVDEDSFWEALRKGAFKENFGDIPPPTLLPMERIEDIQNDINDFFRKLRFVVNYSQNDLDEFIKKKCKKFTGFVSDFVAHEFQVKIGNALNLANKDFISNSKQVDRFFKESFEELKSLSLVGLSQEYREKIELYGIKFSTKSVEDILKLNDSEHFLDSNKQIFNLITEQKDLTYMKFIQAIGSRDEYQNYGSYASLSLNAAVILENFVAEALKSETTNLLVIKCEPLQKNTKHLYSKLIKTLSGVLRSKESKKIILITQKEDDIATEFKSRFSCEYQEKQDRQICLVDLEDESQVKFLEERTLIFQGKETTLEKLFFNEALQRIVHGEVLFDIIEGKEIRIGTRVPSIADANSPAYSKVMECIDVNRLKNVKDDIFVISGIDRASLAKILKLPEDEIVTASKDFIFSRDKPFQYVVLGSENSDENVNDFEDVVVSSENSDKIVNDFEDMILSSESSDENENDSENFAFDSENSDNDVNEFENVCRQYQENLSSELTEKEGRKLIHLIEFHNSKFRLNRYFDPKFYVKRCFNKKVIDKKFINDYFKKGKCVKNIILVGEIQKDKFIKQYGIDEMQVASTCDEFNREGPILILSRDHDKEEAQRALKNLPMNCKFYWLEKKGNDFIWKYPDDEIKTISPFGRISWYCLEDSDKESSEDEQECVECDEESNEDEREYVKAHDSEPKDYDETTETKVEDGSKIYGSEFKDGNKTYKRELEKRNEIRLLYIPESELAGIIKVKRFLVLADIPGMGKSTTTLSLSEFFKKCDPLNWVIKINFRDYEGALDDFFKDHEKCQITAAVNFLSKIDPEGFKHPLAEELLRHKLITDSDHDILLLMDGFDEIPEKHPLKWQKKLVKFLEFLKARTNVKVLVTTRPYEREKRNLEKALSVSSCNFSTISYHRGKQYVERVWQNGLKLRHDQTESNVSNIRTFVTVLLDRCREVFGGDLSSFVGVPLQLQMLAEVYLKHDNGFVKNQRMSDETSVKGLLKNLNFSSLYADFIERKYNIYFQEKYRFGEIEMECDIKDRLKKSYEQEHKHLAFEYLYGESDMSSREYFKLFSPDKKGITSRKRKELNRVGILHIREKNRIDFVHRTFAEYYAAELIFDRFQEKGTDEHFAEEAMTKMWEFLLHRVFLYDNFQVIRNFINCKLSSCDLFENFETNFVRHKNIVQNLLQKIVDREIKKIKNRNEPIMVQTETPLEIVSKEGLSEIVEFMLRIAPSNFIIDTHSFTNNVKSPERCISPWHYAIYTGNLKVAEVLLKYAKKINKSKYLFDHSVSFGQGPKSALSYVSSIGSSEMLQWLFENGAHTESKTGTYSTIDKDTNLLNIHVGTTPLHAVFSVSSDFRNNNQLKKVKYLLEYGLDINAKDAGGNTPLHLACIGADPGYRDRFDCFSLSGCFKDSCPISLFRPEGIFPSEDPLEKMIQLLLTKLQNLGHDSPNDMRLSVSDSINAANYLGFTPIFLAAASGFWNIFRYLMSKVDSVDISLNMLGATTLHILAAEAKEAVLINTMEEFIIKSDKQVNVKTTKAWNTCSCSIFCSSVEGETPSQRVERYKMAKAYEWWLLMQGYNKTKVALNNGSSSISHSFVEGETPLHLAAKNNNEKAVELLLRYGADKNIINTEGQKAADLCQNPTIIRLITEWCVDVCSDAQN